jgi:hypothetical protein
MMQTIIMAGPSCGFTCLSVRGSLLPFLFHYYRKEDAEFEMK